VLFAALACVMLAAEPVCAATLVGTVVPPYPADIHQNEGSCFGGTGAAPCPRSIGVLADASNKDIQILSAVAAPRDGKAPRWLVQDVVAYPEIDAQLVVIYGVCRYGGMADDYIVAVVDAQSKQDRLPARGWAYRIDSGTGKFVKLDSAGVDCTNTAGEAD
jgi:hypothetical protein